jgi:hypothetical protein
MVLNVASTHKGNFATKSEERTVEKERKEIKHKKQGSDRKENMEIQRITLVKNLHSELFRLCWSYQE